MVTIACIEEGKGEVEALPVLLRRIALETIPGIPLEIPHPIRTGRYKIVKPGELEKNLELASAQLGGPGGILILLDSEGECPAKLGPSLAKRVRSASPNLRVAVALAHHEYESWLLAGAAALRGHRGLRSDLRPPPNPEGIPGAKEWLRRQMSVGRIYSLTIDQAALSAEFDMRAARRNSKSFRRFYQVVQRLIEDTGTHRPNTA